MMKNRNLEINFNINTNINNIQRFSPKHSEEIFKHSRNQLSRDSNSNITKRKSEIMNKKSKSNSVNDKSYLTNSGKKIKSEDLFTTENSISLSSTMLAAECDKYIRKENREFIIDEIPPQFEVTPLKKMNITDSFNLMTEFDDFTCDRQIIDLKSATSTTNSFKHQDLGSLYHEYNCNLLILGGKADNNTRKFNIETSSWSICKTAVQRSDFIAIMYKDRRVLIMGGKIANNFGTETITDSIELFNLEDYSMNKLEIKLKYPRSNFGAVFINNTIYVSGGYNGKDVLNNTEYFDKRSKKWIELPKMSNKRKELCLVVGPDSNIYAIGGSDEKEVVSRSAEKLDLEKSIWVRIEDMNQARKAACAVFMPDGIYILGGYDGCQYLKSCEKYDFQSRKWRYISDMNYPKCHFSAISSNDFQYIYTIGGYDTKPLVYIERYDVLSNKWEVIDKLPAPKYRHQSVFVNE